MLKFKTTKPDAVDYTWDAAGEFLQRSRIATVTLL